jgi:hypothetical protein
MDILLCAAVIFVPAICVFFAVGISAAVFTRHERLHQRREFEAIRELMS